MHRPNAFQAILALLLTQLAFADDTETNMVDWSSVLSDNILSEDVVSLIQVRAHISKPQDRGSDSASAREMPVSTEWTQRLMNQVNLEELSETADMLLVPSAVMEQNRKVFGKMAFGCMLVVFFLIFGCIVDDPDHHGLTNRAAEALLREDLWTSERVNENASKTVQAPKIERQKAELPRLSREFPGACSGTVVSIAFDDIMGDTWYADVLGLMGLPVLAAQLKQSNSGYCLEVRTRAGEPTALVKVRSDLWLEDANGLRVGQLEHSSFGFQLVSSLGLPVLDITHVDGHLIFRLPGVSDVAGAVALSRRLRSNFASQRLEVSASRGVDVVLLLACALAIRVLVPEGKSSTEDAASAVGSSHD
jgi:hypothetical protein